MKERPEEFAGLAFTMQPLNGGTANLDSRSPLTPDGNCLAQ
jgi:hypothetical protein